LINFRPFPPIDNHLQSAYEEASRPRQKGSRTPKGTTKNRVKFYPKEGTYQESS